MADAFREWRVQHPVTDRAAVRYQPLYSQICVPDAEWQRCKLEALRAKWAYRAGFRVMSRIARLADRFGLLTVLRLIRLRY